MHPALAAMGCDVLRLLDERSSSRWISAVRARATRESGRERERFFQRRHVAVMDFQFGRRFLGDRRRSASTQRNAHDLIESLHAHRAGVHAQAAADLAGNAFHPLETADPVLRRRAAELLQPDARARGDFAVWSVDFQPREVAARRVDDQPVDATVAHEQIGSAAHDENVQVRDRARTATPARTPPSVDGSAHKRAGPPTRKVVCLESGSYSFARTCPRQVALQVFQQR